MRSRDFLAAPLVFVLLLFAASSVGALNLFGGDDPDVVWQKNPNVYVKYAAQDSDRFGPNEHPVELDEAAVRAALTALRLDDAGAGKDADATRPLFAETQAAMLATQLVKALRGAAPDRDVLFAIDRESPRPLGLRPDIFFTAGRAFFKDGRLNIIVGELDRPRHEGYEKAYDPTSVGTVRYRFNHGTRDRDSRALDDPVVAMTGVQVAEVDGERRQDWLAIDLSTTITALNQQAQQRATAERDAKRQELLELLDERDRALLEQRARQQQYAPPPAAPPQSYNPQQPYAAPVPYPPQAYPQQPYAAPPQGYAPPPAAAGAPLHPVEERMMVLKRLMDRGLITEAEYDQKRKELIDEL